MFLLCDGSASLNSSRSMMDESSLFHYASDSPLGPNGTGGRGSGGGTGVAKQGERFTWGMEAMELMGISCTSKLCLRISATLQAPVRDKQEPPCAICPFSCCCSFFPCIFRHAVAEFSKCCKQELQHGLGMPEGKKISPGKTLGNNYFVQSWAF